MEKKPSDHNYQMCILSALGILFVLLGHLQNTLTAPTAFSGWFLHYSFHMPLFLFISGYFFKCGSGPFLKDFGSFLWKKFRKLIIPYYVINGIFLLFGIITGIELYHYTVSHFFLMPWINYQPITFAVPTWFLAGLFLAEIYYYLLRRLAALLPGTELFKDIVLFLVILALSVGCCYIKAALPVSETAGVWMRSVLMMFFLHIGYLYRQHLEQLDKLPGTAYFAIVFGLQFLLILISRDASLGPGLYEFTGFGRTGFLYYAAGITGIALWLRISRLIAQIPSKSRLLIFIGSNTKYIMSFHLFGYFLLNLLFRLCNAKGWLPDLLNGFDPEKFASDVVYYNCCAASPQTLLLYVLAGMAVSLILALLIRFCGKQIRAWAERIRKTA